MSTIDPDRRYLWALRLILDWRLEEGKSFHSYLFDAMFIADHFQKAKIAKAFPTEFAAFCAWDNAGYTTTECDEFLRKTLGVEHASIPLEIIDESASGVLRGDERT